MRPSRSSAAEFITDFPVSDCAGVTRPQITAMPRVLSAMWEAARQFAWTKEGFSTRSRGG